VLKGRCIFFAVELQTPGVNFSSQTQGLFVSSEITIVEREIALRGEYAAF